MENVTLPGPANSNQLIVSPDMEPVASVTVAVHVVEAPMANVEEAQLTEVDVVLPTVKSTHELEPPKTRRVLWITADLALYEPTSMILDTLYMPAGSVVAGRIIIGEPTPHEFEPLQTLTSTL